jgi:ABC-type glycerol-3-phosphate transport system substrate-binding protein
MKRTWIVLFLGLALILVGGSTFANGAKESVVTLNMMAPWADKELEGFKPVLARFEELNPGIKVEYRTGKPEDTQTMLATQFSVKKTPADIIDTSFSWFIAQQAAKGNVLAIEDVIKASDYRPGSLNDFQINGKLFGVPSIGGLDIVEYNAALFKDNNLTDPRDVKTWDEFIALCKAVAKVPGVKAAFGTGGGVGWTNTTVIQTWVNTFGGKAMYDGLMNGTISWTDPQVKSLLTTYLLPLLQQGFWGEPGDVSAVTQSMWNKQYGFFVGGTTDSLRFRDPPGAWAVTLLPGQKAISMWSDFWFIPAYTAHPKEAKKLIQFLATEGQSIQIKGGGRIATYVNVPAANYPAQEQMILKVIGSGVAIDPDLDDTVGGKFQSTEFDQLKLLWSNPKSDTLDSVLAALQAASVETLAATKAARGQ